MDKGLWVIGEALGTFITSNKSYKYSLHHSVAQVLVALDLRQGLYESRYGVG